MKKDKQLMRQGVICVISGPSGSGKTTLCQSARDADSEIYYTTSCTTRPPRKGEEHGVHYYFLDEAEFTRKINADEFLEHAEVHGHFYGTLKSEVLDHLREGRDVIMDIDVQGAAQIRDCDDPLVTQAHFDVFIRLESIEDLRDRLTGRGTDSEEVLSLRMRNSISEMAEWEHYNYTLISGKREEDLERFQSILLAERHRSRRLTPTMQDTLVEFPKPD